MYRFVVEGVKEIDELAGRAANGLEKPVHRRPVSRVLASVGEAHDTPSLVLQQGVKGGLWSIFGPKTVWEYVKLMTHGRLFRGIQADPFQLGGDFVIDSNGIVRFAHRSEDPADRPAMDRLLQAVRSPAR